MEQYTVSWTEELNHSLSCMSEDTPLSIYVRFASLRPYWRNVEFLPYGLDTEQDVYSDDEDPEEPLNARLLQYHHQWKQRKKRFCRRHPGDIRQLTAGYIRRLGEI